MFSRCSILIVGDDQFARGIIRHHLNRLGVKNIFEAKDGEQALETLWSSRMQLVIADRYMPKLNGLELFCNIQMDPLLKDTPFIMIIIEDDETKIEDALKQGIQHYLVKPFNAETFDDKIQEVLQQPAAAASRRGQWAITRQAARMFAREIKTLQFASGGSPPTKRG